MWLYVPPCEPSSYAQALPCSAKESDLHPSILDGTTALSLTSKGKPLLPPSLSRSWKRNAWIRRLSSLTSAPSTVALGVAAWIASLPDSPASRIPWRASKKGSRTSDGSGPTLPALLASLDAGSSTWKTSQASLLPEDSPPSSLTLPRSGSMRSGGLYLRPMLALRTNASACSSWPTPDCNTATYSNGERGENIRQAAASWGTPSVADTTGGRMTRSGSRSDELLLNGQAAKWQAPEASMADKGGMNSLRSRGDPHLPTQAFHWASPMARDWRGGGQAVTRKDGKSRMDMLDWQAEAFSRQDQKISGGPESSSSGPTSRRRLNPAFAAWLMGWPWWWTNPGVTSSAKSAMESWRSQQLARLSSLCGEPD